MTAVAAVEAAHAYRECQRITRGAATNFFYGISLLPRPQRQAMSAVYAFARRVDDIGDDGDLDAPGQLARLQEERAVVASLAAPGLSSSGDPVALALAHAHHRYQLPLDALEALIEGVELDVRGTRYETFDELVVYCRDVAGSIGRLCLAIFQNGFPDATGRSARLADDLGVAMQLTNILRDVREDHERGRVYLPAEDLRRFGCEALPDVPSARAAALIRFEAERAADWFARGLELVELLNGRSAACVGAMTGIYREILGRIASRPDEVLDRRISLPLWEKMWLAFKSLSGAGSEPRHSRRTTLQRLIGGAG
jgi:phytoene synthase